MTLIPLILLRIPAGFAVCYNGFHDVDPVESEDNNGFLDNWGFFTEDILQIAKMDIKKGDWNIPKELHLTDQILILLWGLERGIPISWFKEVLRMRSIRRRPSKGNIGFFLRTRKAMR